MPPLTPRLAVPLLLALLAVAPGCASARVGPDSFAPLIKRVLPAVVNIAVTEAVSGGDPLASLPPDLQRQFRDKLRGRRQEMMGAGSGFIIDPSGYIVTNNHVVGSADKIVVSLADGTELPARVIGADELTDVALIKVAASHPLPFVNWGSSHDMEVGDWVLAAGNPFGLGNSVTAGIVSARGRDIDAGPYDDFLQVDAPINPGNSGGPVFNTDGQVIGMDTAIVSPTGGSVGIGFAIPSDLVSKIVAELRDHGRIERGWLGVKVQELASGTGGGGSVSAKGGGVGISEVDRQGPAARAGLRPGDIVTSVNGQPIDTSNGLIRAVAAVTPGNSVHLSVKRQGRALDVPVTVGRRPNSQG